MTEPKNKTCQFKSKNYPNYKCPESALANSEKGYCIFHEPKKDKDIEKFNEGIKRKLDNKDYDFRGYGFPASFKEGLFKSFAFEKKAQFEESIFQGEAHFEGCIFEKGAYFGHSTFENKASFRDSIFKRYTSFWGSTFRGFAIFAKSTFEGTVRFVDCIFEWVDTSWIDYRNVADVDFEECTFKEETRFEASTFKGFVIFTKSIFERDVFFRSTSQRDSIFEDNVNFWDCVFNGRADFSETTFQETVFFWDSVFEGEACFRRSTFGNEANFEGSTFKANADFSNSTCRKSDFRESDFQKVIFLDGIEITDSTNADILFRKAKIAWHREGNYIEEGKAHYQEMDYIRKQKRWDIRYIWANLFHRLLHGYGEKPHRVILWATAIITACALLFMNFGIGETRFFRANLPTYNILKTLFKLYNLSLADLANIGRYFYFSVVTFTTLGYGDLRPVHPISHLISSIEAFTGMFMMALFVLTFGRKWRR